MSNGADPAAREALIRDVAGRIASRAAATALSDEWPAESWQVLSESGVLRWGIPPEFGGVLVGPREQTSLYVGLARACLTTAFILTQRNAAVQRLVASTNNSVRELLLPGLASGARFATVGISHLTTSRQHWNAPAVAASLQPDGGYLLHGGVPWVTGADQADDVITGGTLAGGDQVLVAVERHTPGVFVEAPQPLLALGGSRTGAIQLDHVMVTADRVLAGPRPQIMLQLSGGAGSLTTSALAVGHAGAALELLRDEAQRRRDLQPVFEAFQSDWQVLAADLDRAAQPEQPASDLTPESLRTRANSLVLRVSQAALAASKGAGFVRGHPAERLAREALFFLVWSCPQPVLSAALKDLSRTCDLV